MKKISTSILTLLLIGGLCLSAISCSNPSSASDDCTIPVTEDFADYSFAVGTWKLTGASVNYSQNIIFDKPQTISAKVDLKIVWNSDSDITMFSGEDSAQMPLKTAKQYFFLTSNQMKVNFSELIGAISNNNAELLTAFNSATNPTTVQVFTNSNNTRFKTITTYNFNHDASNTHVVGSTTSIISKQ